MKEEIFKAIEKLALDWQDPYDGFITTNIRQSEITLFKNGTYKPLNDILYKHWTWEFYDFLYNFAKFIIENHYYQVRWRDTITDTHHEYWSQFRWTKSGKLSKKQPQYTLDYIYDQFIISQN